MIKTPKLIVSALILILCLVNINLLKAQMVGVNAYIKGTSVEIGIAGLGGFEGCPTGVSPPLPGMHFRSGNPFFGFVSNPQVNAWATFDGDFFTPGSPENGWGIELPSGLNYGNNCSYLNEINGAMTSWSQTFTCISADWQGDLLTGTNLHFKINYFLNQNDLFYTTTVSITNNTAATIPTLYYYRNLDPDNNQPISGDFTTQNTIVAQPFSGLCNTAHVKATSSVPASQPMSYFGLAATGAEWRAFYGGFANRDASDLWNGVAGFTQAVGSTLFIDGAIGLAYRIQNLAPGATETIKFVCILDDLAATQAVANTTFLTYPGSATAPPAACTPYTDTAKICQGVPATIGVTGPNIASYNWSWSPATGLSSSTGATVSANPATTTTYTITGTPINACFSTVSFPIVVYVTPSPTVVPEPNITACAGAVVTANTFASTPAGATFTWTNSNAAIGLAASGTGGLPAFTATNAGGVPITSTITITPSIAGNPCPGLASTFTITINPNPITTANSPTVCAGQTATLTAGGATTYLWNTGSAANPLSVTPATTTTYTVTGTTSGCTGTAISTVTVNPLPVTTVNSPTLCAGQTATLTAGGASTYLWNTGSAANPLSVTPATTTTYTVTGTTLGCTGTTVSTVTVNPIPVTNVNSPTICAGITATLTAGGATSYLWSTGATTNPLSIAPGTTTSYTVTGTSLGCSSTAVSTVTVNPLPVTTVNSPTICPTTTATLTAAGATTYLWSTGSTANPLNVTPAGTTTYTVTGTSLGCTSSAIATVTVGGSITATVNSPTICAGQTATLTATGGTTYTWSTGSTANPITVTPATTTSYTVTANSGGCTGSAIATVTVNPLPVTIVNSTTICNGVTANLTAGGATTYTWTAGASPTGVTTADATPSTTTSYTVTGTSLGCSTTAVATVTVNPIPVTTVNSPSICPAATANLIAGGATTYTWTAGATATGVNTADASPAGTTTYTVTGTSLGCSSTAVATVTVNSALVVNAGLNDSICFGGSAVLGVSPSGAGYLYNWTPAASLTGATTATPTASPATTTTYSVTLTDPSGCTGTSTVTIYADPQIIVNTGGIPVICNGDCDGQTICIPGGGTPTYTYLWSSGCTSAFCPSLCPATYTVTVTDSWGCTGTGTATVTEPTLLTASSTVTPTTCNGVCDGTATATGAGGIVGTGYTYSWNTVPVQTTATATALCDGIYTCTITDANSCTATATATITEPTLVVTAPIAAATICFGGTTTLTASASGGNGGAYNYVWSPAGTGSTASVTVTPVGTTTYTVDATDVNGCPAAPVTVTVTVNPALTVLASGTASICPGASTNISALASFGTGGPYTYTWAPAGTGSGTPVLVSPAATTTYTVTASDGCSPTATSTVTITVLPLPVVLFSAPITAGCAPLCVNFTDNSTVVGGAIATSLWDFGDGNSSTSATPTNCYGTPGSYNITLTVTSTLGGCTSTSLVANYVTVHPNPVADFTIPTSSSILSPTISYTDNSSITSGTITNWDWNFGDPFAIAVDNTSTLQNPTHTFTEAGNYCATLTVTSNFGCVSTTTECLIIEPEFTFFIPNAFSPNDDGINDEFYGKGDYIKDFEMMIFDRWGNLIFFADDVNKHWNGIANHGKEIAQQDVYVYTVKITDANDKKHKYTGTVTIVK